MAPKYIILIKDEDDKKFNIALRKDGQELIFDTFKQALAYAEAIGLHCDYHIEAI